MGGEEDEEQIEEENVEEPIEKKKDMEEQDETKSVEMDESDDYLVAELKRDKLIEEKLGNPDTFLQLIPTMDDDFIQKMYQLAFIGEDYRNFQSDVISEKVINFIKLWLYNPYNAYRFIDLLLFNLLSTVQ